MLRQYYEGGGGGNEATMNSSMDQAMADVCDPFDIDSPDFNSDLFLSKVITLYMMLFVRHSLFLRPKSGAK